MMQFDDAASIAASPGAVTDCHLKRLLTDAVRQWHTAGLLDLTNLLIIEPGDTEEDILREAGYSPLVNPLDGSRFGSPTFQPAWDDLRDRGGFFELTLCIADSGFALVIFVPDSPGVAPELLALCRHNTGAGDGL